MDDESLVEIRYLIDSDRSVSDLPGSGNLSDLLSAAITEDPRFLHRIDPEREDEADSEECKNPNRKQYQSDTQMPEYSLA